jgi:hypothetical protein
VIDGEAELLAGFEFNITGKLGTSLFALGQLTELPGDIMVDLCRLFLQHDCCCKRNYCISKSYLQVQKLILKPKPLLVATSETAIQWDSDQTVDINQLNSVTPNSVKPLFFGFGN